MDGVNVRMYPDEGLCVVWTVRYDPHNRPLHERVAFRKELIPELIEKLRDVTEADEK